jgi:hypothetical protein
LASKELLHTLDRGNSLLVIGRIVSLTQLIRNYDWQEPWSRSFNHIILSLKVKKITLTPDKARLPAMRTPQTRKRGSEER